MVLLLCILQRTNLVVIRGTLKGQRYVDKILHPHVLQSSLTAKNTFLFQQNTALPHTCNMARNCLQGSHVIRDQAGPEF